MAIYERGSGQHVAERVQTAAGSEEDAVYAVLADDPASGWRCVGGDKPKPKRAARGKGGGDS